MKKFTERAFQYCIDQKFPLPIPNTPGLQAIFLVNDHEFNDPILSELLSKIINALKLQAGKDFELIPCNLKQIYTLSALTNIEKLRIVCFGIQASHISLQGFDEIHHPYHFKNMDLLFAHPLKNYNDDQSKKSLWSALKKLF